MEKGSWFIAKAVNNVTFYVADHDSRENTTLWTPKRGESIVFPTERVAHKFIKRYMSDRPDVILVNVQIKYK